LTEDDLLKKAYMEELEKADIQDALLLENMK